MNAQIDENYRVTSDARQYVLERRVESEKRGHHWVTVGYYGTLGQVIRAYAETGAKEAMYAQSIFDVVHEYRCRIDEIERALRASEVAA